MVNELDYKNFKRAGVHGVETIDFIIDNKSLLDILVNKYGGSKDYMGCFSKGWKELKKASKNKLLLKTGPETENGRVLIYLCPECADIGCGAFCCKIQKDNELYKWYDFAYENGYEEAVVMNDIGPFYFKDKLYEELIIKLSLI